MATELIVPKLGMSTEPIMLVEWKVKEGERVEKGSVVLVVETEKINQDIEAEVSGFLHILVEAGQEAPIGSAAALIAETKEELEALKQGDGAVATAEVREAAPVEAPAKAKEAPPAEALVAGTEVIVPKLGMSTEPIMLVEWKVKEGKRVEKGSVVLVVETEKINQDIEAEASGFLHILVEAGQEAPIGSAAGIIVATKEELEAFKKGEGAVAAAEPREAAPVEAPAKAADLYQGRQIKSKIPLTGMRKAIAEHMHRSLSVSAQLTVMGELDVAELVKFRKELLKQEEKLGVRITYTDLVVAAVARLLKEYPLVNASLIDNEIIQWEDINVSVAVAMEEGLIVPVVRNADQKSLAEISKTVRTIAQKARERTLTPEEVQGGTFTITNLGAMGGGYRFETVIINQPESAILGTGGITDRPVVREGKIVIRPIMTYYLTYDHRVFTGAVAAAFVNSLAELLKSPESLTA